MKTLKLIGPSGIWNKHIPLFVIALIVMLFWQMLPKFLQQITPDTALLDSSIWQLLLFACLSFLLLLVICALIFNGLIKALLITPINTMVLQIKDLQLWQQFVLYWALFALLFLGSLWCLVAIF